VVIIPTFTPPLSPQPPPTEEIGHSKKFSLWRWYSDDTVGFIPYGRTVIITSGVAAPLAAEGPRTFTPDDHIAADTGSGEAGQAVFRGAHTYTVTAGEDTILTAAGYTVT
jgi:hypothetical protein